MNEDRVLKTKFGQFQMEPWDGENHSGIDPVCDKVVVRIDAAMGQTRGGIMITDSSVENQAMACITGVLVAIGPHAFEWDSDRAHPWEKGKPEVGMRVLFQKYSGQEYPGLDGNLYRVMQDRVIAGTQGFAERIEPAASGSQITFASAVAA